MTEQIEAIARAFAATILEASNELDIESSQTVGTLVLEINTRNARPDYAGCCATHDFFDANIGMAEAFFSVTGGEPDAASETDAALWNAAWTMAKDAGFWIDES
jgi:hypothetical protein